jgi:16S rRNA (guanine966-N2)-methyltransferase
MASQGKIRIISGKWKRRYVSFPSIQDLRPSPDAVRETLFNWLGQNLEGKSCLDLFAGSGAFGLEAASRGASRVDMVELNREAARSLSATIELLGDLETVKCFNMDWKAFLKKNTQKYDIIFVDPPFRKPLIKSVCDTLINTDCLNDDARVYIESPKSNSPLPIPPTWNIIRESTRGMVKSTLIQTTSQ